MEKVSAVECTSYETEEVYQAVKEAIQRIGFVIPEHKTVLIKPNLLTQNRPEQHTITHYSLIDALCRILSEKNCEILIGDSISFYQQGLTRKAFATSEIDVVANKYGATLIAFEEEQVVRITRDIRSLKELYVPKILLEADMVIDACKLKTHGSLRLSGAIKNMFGCLPGGYKQKIHRWLDDEFELSDVFMDIHRVVKPALSIMDAIVGLDGGPTALGRPVKVSRIIASSNAVALDVIVAKMIGYDPEKLPILLQAKKRGMIENFEDIQVLGEIGPIKFKKLVKKDLNRIFNKDSIFVKDTYVDLSIDDSKCTRHKSCIYACPVDAIKEVDGKIVLDTSVCINCYYCTFVCPEKAIKFMPSPTNKFIRAVRWIGRL
ncbi:DUF362 domain-containing protein [Acetobacterium sp.]|uniref:DUF362 domain-containing protein n=1 Tax=Acetobacterium sp. TaxID=1872094 RepID=UPI002F4129D5